MDAYDLAIFQPNNIAKNSQVATSLLTSYYRLYQQADIRMRLHGLRQLVDDKSVASLLQVCCKLLQVDCQNLLSTGLLQVSSISCYNSANDKLQQA